MQATTIVFDTGERIDHPEDLAAAISRMTGGSIYFHFLEAWRRPSVGMDDFSAWLSDREAEGNLFREAFQSIDFAFSTLSELRGELVEALLFRKRQIRRERQP